MYRTLMSPVALFAALSLTGAASAGGYNSHHSSAGHSYSKSYDAHVHTYTVHSSYHSDSYSAHHTAYSGYQPRYHGYCFHGRYGHDWSSRCWNAKCGCWTYYDSACGCYFYWCQPDECYYPVIYCPYNCYCWN